MNIEQRERAAELIYTEFQALLPPWKDLDTDRQVSAQHMGAGLRHHFYQMVDRVAEIINETGN